MGQTTLNIRGKNPINNSVGINVFSALSCRTNFLAVKIFFEEDLHTVNASFDGLAIDQSCLFIRNES